MKKDLINYEIPENTDDDVVHNWEPLKKTIDSKFKYEHTNVFYLFFSRLLWWIAMIVLTPLNYVLFGAKIENKKNLKKINGGAVIVSNHVHMMDMTMILTRVAFPHKFYILADKSSFQIPLVRRLVGPLGAIPIADTLDGKRACFAYIDKLLKNKKKVVFFSEGSMWPYYNKLRPFKDGAFKFAYKNDVPIVPLCVTFREPKGIYKLYKRKPLITISVLEAIYPDKSLNELECRNNLKTSTFEKMRSKINEFY